MRSLRLSLLLRCALFALPLVTAACSDFDWFDEKKTPLAGDRRPMFPAGVPGVNYNEPPQQPTNSNIPVTTDISGTSLGRPPPPPQESEQPPARGKSRNARNVAKNAPPPPPAAAQPVPENDPWSDARTTN